ncbi:MAG TPA: hypothetical protein VF759_14565 [Allosphingosinicella sp.]
MRYINILAAVAATLAIGSTASAKDKPEQRKEKKICKHEPSSTSRLGTRICKTKAQWDAQRNSGGSIEDNGKLQSMGRVN